MDPFLPDHPTFEYITGVSLKNIACFANDAAAAFARDGKVFRWSVILGNNGDGKTTLLRALLTPTKWYLPSVMPIIPLRQGQPGSITVETPVHRRRTVIRVDETFGRKHAYTEDEDGDFENGALAPLAYSASRRPNSDFQTNEPTPVDPLGDDAVLRNADEWLIQADYNARGDSPLQEQARERFDLARKTLIDILPGVTDIRIAAPTSVDRFPAVEFHTPDGWIPYNNLGFGYRTTIAWMVDLVSLMIDQYPESKSPIEEPAVVLVDEIDLHLHPRWQRQLMRHLSEKFTRTQFIVTAHSPLFVQAAAGANLIVLRRDPNKADEVVIDNQPESIEDWRLDQIVTSDLFGLDSARSPQITADLNRREELAMKASLTPDEQSEFDSLRARIADLPTGETAQEVRDRDLLKRTLAILQKKAANG